MILQAKLNNHMSTHTNALAAAAVATGQNRDQLVVQAMDRGRFVAATGLPPPTVAKIEQFVEQPKFVTVEQKQFTVNT